MNVKTMISLILVLAFQLAQILSGMAVNTPCPSHAQSCACCLAGKICHCADHGNPDPQPPPAPFESSRLLQLPAMTRVETQVCADLWRATASSAAVMVHPHPASAGGFAGVRLAVAFCSWVI